MREIQNFVGIDCDGYKEQFLALFTAIEAGHHKKNKGELKKHWELKRLDWSMNMEGSSNCGRVKGKGLAIPQ